MDISRFEKRVYLVALTGGPSGGKTSCLSYISSRLMDLGFRALVNPEIPTLLIPWGFRDIGYIAKNKPELYKKIQFGFLKIGVEFLKTLISIGESCEERVVILSDRAGVDGKAYMNPDDFDEMLRENNLSYVDVRDCFDIAIHLVTAADGAEGFYTTENNIARTETPEEARVLDKRTQEAWSGHHNFQIIDNSTNFEGKMSSALHSILRSIGSPLPLQIQRRFVLQEIPDFKAVSGVQTSSIEQTYLLGPDENRIRKRTLSDGSTIWSQTVKVPTNSPEARLKYERVITEVEFMELLSQKDFSRETIRKIRRCFPLGNQYFEVDEFKNPKRFPMVQMTPTEINRSFDLPSFFGQNRDCTGDSSYSNYALAIRR